MARNIDIDTFIMEMSVRCNIEYTTEQIELIKHFGDGPAFCFADPGTGKTFTAIGGLISAEVMKGIPGDSIYALSFTRMATGELAVRHGETCKKVNMSRQVNFITLHALCRRILSENYKLLGLNKFEVSPPQTMEKSFTLVDGTLHEWGVVLNQNQIRSSIRACTTLNSSLVFDPQVVATKMCFKEANVDFETFTKIRGLLLAYDLQVGRISVSNLLLLTVLLLQQHPEISEAFKRKCRLMLVDEAQDLSLLQLRIISLLTDNPILIGDMKQQIYGFNGACQEVAQRFFELYPNARTLQLTQSFRCRDEIVEYATRIILPNKIGGEDYKGIGPGGLVQESNKDWKFDVQGIVNKIRDEFLENRRVFPRTYMFLTRNNISLTGVIEKLFQAQVPFRVNNFVPAYEIPIISELCQLVKMCYEPSDPRNCLALRYLIPEFKQYYNVQEHPYYMLMNKLHCTLFEVNYQFKDPRAASDAFKVLQTVCDMLNRDATMGEMFNALYPLYNMVWLDSRSWMLENTPKYYTNSVAELTHKPYNKFIMDEVEKKNVAKESETYGRGVRCYTMHASKGLEADVVYIVDAVDGVIPNTKKLDNMLKKQCEVDAARAIREERSLCYVACTRARKELYIVAQDGDVAPIIRGDNIYLDLDFYYDRSISVGDDIKAFLKFAEEYLYDYI